MENILKFFLENFKKKCRILYKFIFVFDIIYYKAAS
jgi:hypothetical protein